MLPTELFIRNTTIWLVTSYHLVAKCELCGKLSGIEVGNRLVNCVLASLPIFFLILTWAQPNLLNL